MTSTVNRTMQVPLELFDQLQQHLATLQMTQQANSDTSDEINGEFEVGVVKKVINHRVNSETGEWSFHIMFTNNTTEWIEDAKCDCEMMIGEYMATRQLRTAHVFCRVSTKEQASSSSTSLATQESELRKAVIISGCAGRIRVHKLSASAYKKIPTKLVDIGDTAVEGDSIYVWRVDRLSRNISLTLSWVEDLDSRGVNLVAFSEGLTFRNNKLAFIQCILDAQKEAKLLGDRIKMSYKYRRERGDEAVGRLAYGKKYHRVMTSDGLGTQHKLVVDNPEEILVIRRIKTSTSCATRLAQTLKSEGITKRGRQWSATMITAMLKAK